MTEGIRATTVRRAPLIALLTVSLVGAFAIDRVVPTGNTSAAGVLAPSAAAPLGALSSSWYCAAGTSQAGAAAEGEVVVANPGTATVRVAATVIPSQGEPATRRFVVPPAARRALRTRDVVRAPYAATLVEVEGGGVVVEHSVSGPLGFDHAACATSGSPRWYLAEGATSKGSTLLLALFNPFPEDAIADLAFATDQGTVTPPDLQALVVPKRSLVVTNISDHVRRRESVATQVIARRGRLVVEKLQLRDEPGHRGLALALAAPRLSNTWRFAEGLAQNGFVERFHVFNPGSREAEVDVEVTLDEGVAEPIKLVVPADGQVTLLANGEDAVPKAVGHSTTVRSLNGVPVVVERSFEATGRRQGRTATTGATRAARVWVLAAGAATQAVEEWVVVANAGATPARLTMTALVQGRRIPVDRLGGLVLAPGARRGFLVNDALPDRAELTLIVTATAPVVVERALYRVGRLGISSSFGVPLS